MSQFCLYPLVVVINNVYVYNNDWGLQSCSFKIVFTKWPLLLYIAGLVQTMSNLFIFYIRNINLDTIYCKIHTVIFFWFAPVSFTFIHRDLSAVAPLLKHICEIENTLNNNWAASWENGPSDICKQQSFRRACASAQSRQKLCCLL